MKWKTAMEYRKHDPKLPKNTTNPTMTQPIIDRASRDIVARYRKVYAGIKERITSLDLTPAQTESLLADVDAILTRWILEGKEPKRLWYGSYTSEAATLGATQAQAGLAALSSVYAAERTVEAIVYSDAFLSRVALAKMADFAEFSEIKGAALNDISSILTQAVADGAGVKETARQIGERLEVSASKAKLYAQTSLPNTLREATWAENDWAREELDIKTALLWTSAQKPTTRLSHGRRHGKVYTTAEVREFYSKDGNRYNCYCAQTQCLVDEQGNLIASPELKKGMAEQRKKWLGDREDEQAEKVAEKPQSLPSKNEEIKANGIKSLDALLAKKMRSGKTFAEQLEYINAYPVGSDEHVYGVDDFVREFRPNLIDDVSSVRSMASEIKTEGRKTLAKELVNKAANLLPVEWIRAAEGLGKLHVKTVRDRGFAWTAEKDYFVKVKFGQGAELDAPKKGDGIVTLSKGEFSTAFHELVHRVQSARPDIDAVFQWEHKRRTANDPLESLRSIVPRSNYDRSELAKKDGYINPYFGKEYGEKGALEMMTMTLETLFTKGSYDDLYGTKEYLGSYMLVQLLSKDKELAGIGLGVMKWM